MTNSYVKYLNDVVAIAKLAGKELLQIYKQHTNHNVKIKADNSPQTVADLRANELITQELNKLAPDIPVLSEEVDVPYEERRKWPLYWLIDPLDGTQEFIDRTGEFCVNIALIEKHKVVLGVVYAPMRRLCYFAAVGKGAFKEGADGNIEQIKTRTIADSTIKVLASRNIGVESIRPFLQQIEDYELTYYAGALKLCFIAEGSADVFPRLGSNYEWDTAAGQCIVEQAGGSVVDLEFQPLQYNTKDDLHNPYFMVVGDLSYNWQKYLEFLRN